MSGELRYHPHGQFIEENDLPQIVYERARKAALDRRVRCSEAIRDSVRSHGLAGLFIDPERLAVSSRLSETRNHSRRHSAFHCAHLPDRAFATIARSLAEGVGVAATARIQGINKKTVLRILTKAAEHAKKVTKALIKNLKVLECQLDEMWSFIGKKEKNLASLEKLQGELGDAWIWIAFDAVNKVVLGYVIGKRTLPHAVRLIEEVKNVTDGIPGLFSSDQLSQYPNALLQIYGKFVRPRRKPGPGRPPKPRLVPPSDLLYVQVVKRYKKYRVVEVTRKVVFGEVSEIEEILKASPVSDAINTAFIERYNGTIRKMDSRCARKTIGFSKCKLNHERQLALTLAYYHLCCPHHSLSKRNGKPTTPLMAAGITDYVWTMEELLTYDAEKPCD